MMELFRILDDLESIIRESKKVPLSSGKVVIDSSDFLERIDRIRAIVPEEMETARLIISEKERIIKEACKQADEYIDQSRDKVAQMVDENEITRNAIKMSEQIISEAEEEALAIRTEANEYARQVLSHMESVLRKGLDTIVKGKDELRREIEKAAI
jgi:isocitrate lyase